MVSGFLNSNCSHIRRKKAQLHVLYVYDSRVAM
jgi:hypothetical protein